MPDTANRWPKHPVRPPGILDMTNRGPRKKLDPSTYHTHGERGPRGPQGGEVHLPTVNHLDEHGVNVWRPYV